MTQLTIETQVKLGMLVGSMRTAEARIHSLRASIAKMEQKYKELCRGFARGQEPAEPFELVQQRDELISVVAHFDHLGKQINTLEKQTTDKTHVRVISCGKNSAMVVLTGTDEITGKKVSVTRHLRHEGRGRYTGKSLFGHRIVSYELEVLASEKAA